MFFSLHSRRSTSIIVTPSGRVESSTQSIRAHNRTLRDVVWYPGNELAGVLSLPGPQSRPFTALLLPQYLPVTRSWNVSSKSKVTVTHYTLTFRDASVITYYGVSDGVFSQKMTELLLFFVRVTRGSGTSHSDSTGEPVVNPSRGTVLSHIIEVFFRSHHQKSLW